MPIKTFTITKQRIGDLAKTDVHVTQRYESQHHEPQTRQWQITNKQFIAVGFVIDITTCMDINQAP